jgi:hypothetical protein
VIAQGVSDVFTAANIESLPKCNQIPVRNVVGSEAIEAEPSTHIRYKTIVERFVEFRAKGKRDLSTLAASDIAARTTKQRTLAVNRQFQRESVACVPRRRCGGLLTNPGACKFLKCTTNPPDALSRSRNQTDSEAR